MKVQVNYSENLPGDEYKTRRWSAELSQEIPDNTDVLSATRMLFKVAKSAVRSELETAKDDSVFNQNQPAFVPALNGARLVTDKQLKYLKRLGLNAGLTPEQVNAMPYQYFKKHNLEELTSKEASSLIEILSGSKRKAA